MNDLTHIAAAPRTAPAPSPWATLIGQPGAEHALDAIAERHRRAVQAGQPEPIRVIFDGPSGTGKSAAAKLLGRRVVLDTHRFNPSDGANLGHVACGRSTRPCGGRSTASCSSRLLPDVAARVELSDIILSTITAADITDAVEAVIQPWAHTSGAAVRTGT